MGKTFAQCAAEIKKLGRHQFRHYKFSPSEAKKARENELAAEGFRIESLKRNRKTRGI